MTHLKKKRNFRPIIFGFYRMLHSFLKHPFKILQSILHVSLLFFFFLHTIFFCSIMLFPLVLSCFFKISFSWLFILKWGKIFMSTHRVQGHLSSLLWDKGHFPFQRDNQRGQGDAPGHQSNFLLKVLISQSRLCSLLAVWMDELLNFSMPQLSHL